MPWYQSIVLSSDLEYPILSSTERLRTLEPHLSLMIVLGTPSNCSTPAPEMRTGRRSACWWDVRSSISLPSQWTVSGTVAENSDRRLVAVMDLCFALARCIEFRLIFNVLTSCPRLEATSLKMKVAFLDDTFVLSKLDVRPGDIMFIKLFWPFFWGSWLLFLMILLHCQCHLSSDHLHYFLLQH